MFGKTQFKVIAIVLLMVLSVAFIGINTYRKLGGILDHTEALLKPDHYLLEVQQLLNKVSAAESNVRSFRLTQDKKYIAGFHQALKQSHKMLESVYGLRSDSTSRLMLDSLTLLIEQKTAVLQRILEIESSETVTSELAVITHGLEDVDVMGSAKQTAQQKQGFLKRLLGKKRKQPNIDSVVAKVSREVEHKVSTVKSKQINRLKGQKAREFELLLADGEITEQMQLQVAKIEQYEKGLMQRRIEEAGVNADEVRHFNLLFALGLSVMLILIGLVLINFIQKNNEYTQAIEQARNEALNLAKTKESFLANMSHEIRTPLTAVIGFAEQLKQQALSPGQREQVQAIYQSSEFLHHLINDILDYSKLVAHKFEQTEHRFSPATTLHELEQLFAGQIQRKQLQFRLTVSGDVPEWVSGDALRLKQILINLVSNSIKFTHTGSITVSCTSEFSGMVGDQCTLRFTVTDTGIGIEPERLDKVFNEFEQANASIAGKYGGTGLGLSISKKLIEFLGGAIELQSTPGRGTRISFTLPYKITTGVPVEKRSEKTSLALHGLSALIADDEPFNITLLRTILEKWGVTVVAASNGAEAFDRFRQGVFDVLLIDVRMPEMNGPDLIRKIRQEAPGFDKAIVLLTAESQYNADDMEKLTIHSMLVKPYTEQQLLGVMAEIFKNREVEMPIPKSNDVPIRAAVDLAELKKLSAQNPALFEDLLTTFINSTENGIAKLEEVIRKGNVSGWQDWAHRLAPPCRHVGATALLALFKQLEKETDIPRAQATFAQLQQEATAVLDALRQETDTFKHA